MNKPAFEVNFDGIVGPTHNYSGLAYGNIASMDNRFMESSPKEAALQGLEKMRVLSSLGVKQAVLPPHDRPHMPTLRALGFEGADDKILAKASLEAPEILLDCSSAAPMWAANAATVCPSSDSRDQRVHFTPANMNTKLHRAIEAETTSVILKRIFSDLNHFVHHAPLVGGSYFSDEGAANHTRFCDEFGHAGVQLFVYGRSAFNEGVLPQKFPARQTLEASQAIARCHQLDFDRVLFVQQNPWVVDQGVFHNDVIAVGNQNVFFYHEKAFLDTPDVISKIQKMVPNFIGIEVKEAQISVADAVSTYLFNSQIVTLPDGSMAFIAPTECVLNESVRAFLQELSLSKDHPIKHFTYMNLKESMRNGGGPACLRLRVVLTEEEWQKTHAGVIFNDALYARLVDWVKRHYRDRLTPQDLGDPALLNESRGALDELTQILQLGSVYAFQR